jgi:glycine/D-amino acid oxidase-like deaminating enzyme
VLPNRAYTSGSPRNSGSWVEDSATRPRVADGQELTGCDGARPGSVPPAGPTADRLARRPTGRTALDATSCHRLVTTDYRKQSFWLESCGDDLRPRPPLQGQGSADVVIVGAGFTGLWTAYYLLMARPDLNVVILDANIAGFGASGRNGGGCSGRLGNQATLRAGWSPSERDRMQRAQDGTLAEIRRVIETHSIACDFELTGSLSIATGPEQLQALRAAAAALPSPVSDAAPRVLSPEELAARVRVASALGAILSPGSAVLHPGRLVRGLARVVESMGARIFEESRVESITSGSSPTVVLGSGKIRAKDVVLSCESYLGQFPQCRRRLVPITSSIVLTEPLTASDWAEIGWEGRELLTDFRLSVLYLQRTADGRILIGGRGAPYRFASGLSPDHNGSESIYELLRATGRSMFPVLRRVKFSHAWSGSLGVPRDYHPSVRYHRERHVLVAGGYTGTGVGPSNLFGRIAADLLGGKESDLTALPLVGRKWRRWEPEPLRWLGIRYVQSRLLGLDARARRTGVAPAGRSLAERWRPR